MERVQAIATSDKPTAGNQRPCDSGCDLRKKVCTAAGAANPESVAGTWSGGTQCHRVNTLNRYMEYELSLDVDEEGSVTGFIEQNLAASKPSATFVGRVHDRIMRITLSGPGSARRLELTFGPASDEATGRLGVATWCKLALARAAHSNRDSDGDSSGNGDDR